MADDWLYSFCDETAEGYDDLDELAPAAALDIGSVDESDIVLKENPVFMLAKINANVSKQRAQARTFEARETRKIITMPLTTQNVVTTLQRPSSAAEGVSSCKPAEDVPTTKIPLPIFKGAPTSAKKRSYDGIESVNASLHMTLFDENALTSIASSTGINPTCPAPADKSIVTPLDWSTIKFNAPLRLTTQTALPFDPISSLRDTCHRDLVPKRFKPVQSFKDYKCEIERQSMQHSPVITSRIQAQVWRKP